MPAGRPSKLSPEKQEAICAALRTGNTRTAAAGCAGIDRHTFANWMERYPPFLAAVEKAEHEAEARFVGQVAKAATDGTWTAAAWWLERRRPDDWKKRDETTLVGDKEKPVRIEAIDYRVAIAPLAPGPVVHSLPPGEG